MITACLNGDRTRRHHPSVPKTPRELARAAEDSVAAGASMVHVHPRDGAGLETLEARHVVDVVAAIRAASPGLRVSVSTRDGIVEGAADKLAHLSEWVSPRLGGPDCASVNWHEEGAAEVAEALREKGIGVEAGIWTADAARRFRASRWPGLVEQVLVETIPGMTPGTHGPAAAQGILAELGSPGVPVLVHGEEGWAWPVLRWAQGAGFDLRIGLEDTCHLPTGQQARDNAELVRVAAAGGPAGGARHPLRWD